MDRVSALADTLAGCTSVRDLYGILTDALAGHGFPWWSFVSIWGDGAVFGDPDAPAAVMTMPDGWIRTYVSAQYDRVDPMRLVVPYASGAVRWQDVRHYCPALFDDAAVHGLLSGLAFPLRTLAECHVLSVARPDQADLSPADLLLLEMIAAGFFSRWLVLRPQPDTASLKLTANTREALRLTMAGKTRKEIAVLLGITVDGVHWCLKDAKAQLQCRTTEEALLRAVALGILRV